MLFFGKKKEPEQTPPVVTLKDNPVRIAYAYFHVAVSGKDDAYERGLQDFDDLVKIPGVVSIGISPDSRQLLVGTECIDVIDGMTKLREIGEFIVMFAPYEKRISFENVTRTLPHGIDICFGNVAHHPHILNGTICMTSGMSDIMLAVADGRFSRAMQIIMLALRMDNRFVTRGGAYSNLSNWPVKSEVKK